MSVDEFDEWLADYRDRFPLTDEWLSKQPDQERLLRFWKTALDDVKFSDAMSVNARLMRGDLAAIENYDRDKIPAIVRGHANVNRTTAAEDAEKYRPSRQPRSPVKGSSRETLCRIETLMASGISSQEARRQIEPDDESDERYKCLACRDSGWVDVFSYVAIAAAIRRTPFPQGAPARMSVRCTCARASKKEKVERYSPNRYCVYDDNPERLEEWIVRIQAADLERRRFKEFDEFNNR